MHLRCSDAHNTTIYHYGWKIQIKLAHYLHHYRQSNSFSNLLLVWLGVQELLDAFSLPFCTVMYLWSFCTLLSFPQILHTEHPRIFSHYAQNMQNLDLARILQGKWHRATVFQTSFSMCEKPCTRQHLSPTPKTLPGAFFILLQLQKNECPAISDNTCMR